MKYYAVLCGRQTGIFISWIKCKSLVDGYSGAVYKSFKTLKEAQSYIDDNIILQPSQDQVDPHHYHQMYGYVQDQ